MNCLKASALGVNHQWGVFMCSLPSVRTYSKRLHVRMGPPIPPSADFIGHTVGKGKHQLAVYLDYTCPFSGKMYNMLFGQVGACVE